LVFVVQSMTADMNSPDVAHTGFNLDNRFSTANDAMGCSHEDYVSALDLDQNMGGGTCMMGAGFMAGCGGVDNQIPALFEAVGAFMPNLDVNQVIRDQINQGKLSLIVQVLNLDTVPNDNDVTVRLFLGYPNFMNCATQFMQGTTPEYSIAASSLAAGSTDLSTARFVFQGRLVNGRLQVSSSGNVDFPLPEIMGLRLTFALHQAQFRMTIAGTGTMASAYTGSNANLGGWVDGNEMLQAVLRVPAAAANMMVVEGAIGTLVDIQSPAGVCFTPRVMTTPPSYGGVSLGMGIGVFPARLATGANAVIMDRAAGTCGFAAPTPDAGPGG